MMFETGFAEDVNGQSKKKKKKKKKAKKADDDPDQVGEYMEHPVVGYE